MVNEAWGALAILGFWGWILCTIGFIIKSFPRRDSFFGPAGRFWGSLILVFYCLWVAGMLNA